MKLKNKNKVRLHVQHFFLVLLEMVGGKEDSWGPTCQDLMLAYQWLQTQKKKER